MQIISNQTFPFTPFSDEHCVRKRKPGNNGLYESLYALNVFKDPEIRDYSLYY